jgi:hypothetical protein
MQTTLYREEDIEAVSDKIKEIMKMANKKAKDTLDLTYKEYLIVFKHLTDYIKKNNRIVYGGIALNEMLKDKSPKDVIYEEYSINDIEIYSPDPVTDIFKICDMLHEKKFLYVQASEAQHPGTFTIFANFEKYCDITYVPKLIYNNMPTINVNGFRLIHPIFILTDTLRVYTDPLTSYFRLDKSFTRGNLLLKVANYKPQKGVIQLNKPSDRIKSILHSIIPKISELKDVIFIDDIAYNDYMDLDINDINEISIILPRAKDNSQKVYNILVDAVAKQDVNFKEHMKIEEYNTFFQFWEHRIIIKYNNKPIITIYANVNKCLPYREIEFFKTKINVANFTLTILYFMIHFIYNKIFKLNISEYEHRIGNLLDKRNTFLDKKKLTILDDTKYKEFQIECLGTTTDFIRSYRLRLEKRGEKGGVRIYRYTPGGKNNTLSSEFKFPNEAGTLITNDNLKYIKPI